MSILEKIFRIDQRAFNKIRKKAQPTFDYEDIMANLTDEELQAKTPYFREKIAAGASLDDLLPEAFATCREAARRVLGQYPYPVQVFGSTVLHEGDIAEMKTGEGKTLTETMAVYLNGLSGKGVHVVTVNEYLASRDADWMGQIYRFLGLSVGVNLREKSTLQKKEAYKCDITYTTNSELGFDYLRDNMATTVEGRVLRGLQYAIIDEADSILIDESRTPLIISGGSGITANSYQTADRICKQMKNDVDFEIDIKKKICHLLDPGVDKVQKAFGIKNLYDPKYNDLVHRIQQALKANYIMKRDTEYMVANNEILLVDTFTGRVMQGREYSDGLQQAIQAKEHVEIKPETVTLATITYQNFFRLYHKIAGMTGTAKTEEEEFRKTYNMRVVIIPTNRPIQRKDDIDTIYANQHAKFQAVVEETKKRHALGQPVLIGTASVEKSEIVDKMLNEQNIPHEVLNAKNHAREAQIIAKAGEKGAITIATNMAGRGTDIKIDDEVKALGGLAVLGTERHESRRIDNQLRGRAGRQGDPGYSKFFVSLDDDLLRRFSSDSYSNMFKKLGAEGIDSGLLTRAITQAQKRVEGQNFDTRKHLLSYDDILRQQREIMYGKRDKILYSESIYDTLTEYFDTAVKDVITKCMHVVDSENVIDDVKLKELVEKHFLSANSFNAQVFKGISFEEGVDFLSAYLKKLYDEKRKTWTEDMANYAEKTIALQCIDREWTKHIDTMAKLREAIYLRSYANTDPLQAYTNEGYQLFAKMNTTIALNFVHNLLHVQIKLNDAVNSAQQEKTRQQQTQLQQPQSQPEPLHEPQPKPIFEKESSEKVEEQKEVKKVEEKKERKAKVVKEKVEEEPTEAPIKEVDTKNQEVLEEEKIIPEPEEEIQFKRPQRRKPVVIKTKKEENSAN